MSVSRKAGISLQVLCVSSFFGSQCCCELIGMEILLCLVLVLKQLVPVSAQAYSVVSGERCLVWVLHVFLLP